jgi:hypothetical protein
MATSGGLGVDPMRKRIICERLSTSKASAQVFRILVGASVISVSSIMHCAAQIGTSPGEAQTACWTRTCGPEMCPAADLHGPGAVGNCIRQCRAHSCQIATTVIYPRYLVMNLIYAPPGCGTAQARCTPSQVDYATGSSMGSKTTIQNSFKMGTASGFSISIGYDSFVKFGETDNDQFVESGSVTDSETITKSRSAELKLSGNLDGIDHGQDRFVIMLNPAIAFAKLADQIFWNIGVNGRAPQYYDLTVDMLKHPEDPNIMSPQTAALLASRGLTKADFDQISRIDPFANGAAAIDPRRYILTSQIVPYDKPSSNCGGGGCSCLTRTVLMKNDYVQEHTQQSGVEVTQSFSSSAGGTLKIDGLNFNSANSLTSISSSTISNTIGNSNSASYTINCPSVSYTGPTQLAVYWDTIYGTFMFMPIPADGHLPVLHAGVVVGQTGAPLANQPVTLSVGPKTFRTWSGQNGSYKFPNIATLESAAGDKGMVQTAGSGRSVQIGDPTQLRLTVP